MSYARDWANVTGCTYAYKRQRERLQGRILHLEKQQNTPLHTFLPLFCRHYVLLL